MMEVNEEAPIKELKTNTTLFLVPVFELNTERLGKLGFVDAYLRDIDKEDKDLNSVSIYMVFHPNTEEKVPLKKMIELWEETDILIEDYDYSDGYIVVVLKFPEKYRDQYKLFLNGQYSKFSTEYKDVFPKSITTILPSTGKKHTGDSIQYMVCFKRTKLKEYWEERTGIDFSGDMEYWSKPIMSVETLNIEEVKQKKIKEDERRNNKKSVSQIIQ